MKNIQFILLAFVAIILLQSCKKNTAGYPMTLYERIKNSSGTVTARLNGKPWASTLTRAYYWQGGVGIVAEHYLNEDLHEAFSIDKINPLLEYNEIRYHNPVTYEYENADGVQALFGIVEGDADLADYTVIPDTMANNYVEITSYNEATREIKGRFQISFYRTYTVEKGVYDTVRLTDGVFNLKIK